MAMTRILSWNVNGIRAVARKQALEPLVNEQKPDIICLQETKASEDKDIPSSVQDLGYHIYLSHSQEKKGYSGVAILSKQPPENVSEGIGIPEFDREGRVLQADYGDFILFSVYFPNGKASDERLDFKMRFYAAFEEYVENLRQQGRHIIICGDVNTAHTENDLARPRQNEQISGFLPKEREWITGFLKRGYIDTLREFTDAEGMYTWWVMRSPQARANNVGWRLDYFYINQEFRYALKDAYVLQHYKGSDHCPIGIDIAP